MLTFNSVMIGTTQLKTLADFYEKVIGKPADFADDENGFHGWMIGNVMLGVLKHSEMGGKTKDPGRVMINFETARGAGRIPAHQSPRRNRDPRALRDGRRLDRHPRRPGRQLLPTDEPDGDVAAAVFDTSPRVPTRRTRGDLAGRALQPPFKRVEGSNGFHSRFSSLIVLRDNSRDNLTQTEEQAWTFPTIQSP